MPTDTKLRRKLTAPTAKKVRTLTVTNRSSRPTYRQVPQVRMSGDWLGEAGFQPGAWLDIQVSNRRLVITVVRDAVDTEVLRKATKDLQRAYCERSPKSGHKF